MTQKRSICTGTAPIENMSRRQLLGTFGMGLGATALGELLHGETAQAANVNVLAAPHFAPRAKRIIYLFQSGAPSQLDLFDYKPELKNRDGEPLPESVRMGQRLTTMTSNRAVLPMAAPLAEFAQHGESGAWVSDMLPHTAAMADDLCFVKALHTEAINHDPGVTFVLTGSEAAGRPSMGSWMSYGLGSENENLPVFVVLITNAKGGQPLYSRLWGSAFLPKSHQGVQFRAGKDPVLYLNDPAGVRRESRRAMLDKVAQLQKLALSEYSDGSLDARIAQFEMAFRMQTSVPEVTNLSDEPESTFEAYGPDSRTPGTYAANCILARRLAERGVRFIQLFHQGWDHHERIQERLKTQCRETDQPSAALVHDLRARGLLDDTLVVWGGEFGRSNYRQVDVGWDPSRFGRDHHSRAFTAWMAGGGVKPGISHGTTDELGFNVVENGVHIHDFQATMLHLLGIDHERLTHKYQGRYFRLTDVHGKVVHDLLA